MSGKTIDKIVKQNDPGLIGADMKEALTNAYTGVEEITWEGAQFRRDIGKDILSGRG